MNTKRLMVSMLLGLCVSSLALADPCGMVPPIYTGQEVLITRIGLQKTYVFHKNGVETFVIRPGFSGKIDEFGMLIPFPSVPAIRKAPDNVFEHLANAIDPPEYVIDLRPQRGGFFGGGFGGAGGGGLGGGGMEFGMEIAKHEVRVIKEEAVGMYEVAVLQAGSAEALNKWMDEHKYQYPKGMDEVAEEYIEEKWCFVAVKTRVGQKDGVDPKPGQREANADLEPGSAFDGFVQAMGFRFHTKELVVPMRLSTFNEGDLHNVVYILTDSPRMIREIPEEYVVRQVSGEQLRKNVTQPLPLRILGGEFEDIPDFQRVNLKTALDPIPKNGLAKQLFAADLMSVATRKLSLDHEEEQKQLLRIGEQLELRGADFDKLIEEEGERMSRLTEKANLKRLDDMTLTVVDGEFPREVLARQNLKFPEFRLAADKNNAQHYDAKLFGPGEADRGGVLIQLSMNMDHVESILADARDKTDRQPTSNLVAPSSLTGQWIYLLGVALAAGVAMFLIRRKF
jgi:hypothetical protein